MKDVVSFERTVLQGFKCEAEYSDQQVPLYKNNPLIEALPIPWEHDEISRLITFCPPYDDSQREWSKTDRMQCVEQLIHFVQPLRRHIELEVNIECSIRGGYIARNPVSPLFKRQFVIGFRELLKRGLDQDGVNMAGIRSTAGGFTIIGLSGMGKSLSVVWLKLECPASGSLGVLCQNFFRAVDLILETNYFKKHVVPKATKEKLLAPMAQVASLHGLGILVIDEIQRLSLQKNGGEKEMLNFFTELINTIGIPIVLIGTYKSEYLFDTVFAEARRATGQGHDIIKNLSNGLEWKLFLESLWRLQWTKKSVPLTSELRDVMYWESQGVLDIAVKLYMIAQWRAISRGKEEVTVELLQEIASEKLKLVQPMLNALRNGDWALIKILDSGDSKDWLDFKSCKQEEMTHIHTQGKGSIKKKNNVINAIDDEVSLDTKEQVQNNDETLKVAKKASRENKPLRQGDLRGIAINNKLVNVPVKEKLQELGVNNPPCEELMV